jgi:ribosomal protein S18 acetylase RimI-like enzyme
MRKLIAAINTTLDGFCLANRDLEEEVLELKQQSGKEHFMVRQENKLEFIDYDDTYKEDLKRLTLEWLEKYFSIQPEDLKFIDNPKSYVLDKGGCIYLAKYNNEVIGTVSLCKLLDSNIYELAKLAVTEKYRGRKLGRQITQFAIDKCKELKARQIILYTAKRLEAAYNLYLQLGFVEIVTEQHKYIEADVIVMELDLTKE